MAPGHSATKKDRAKPKMKSSASHQRPTSSTSSSVPNIQPSLETSSDRSPDIQRLLHGKRRLRFGSDLGTRYTSVTWAETSPTEAVATKDPITRRSVRFDNEFTSIPTEVAIRQHESGASPLVFFGRVIEARLKDDSLKGNQVVTMLKFALLDGQEEEVLGKQENINHSEKRAHNFAKKIKVEHEQSMTQFLNVEMRCSLRCPPRVVTFTPTAVRDILKIFLIWLLDHVKLEIANAYGLRRHQVDDVLTFATVAAAVPHTWSFHMMDDYRELLIEAGWPAVQIVSEAKCSAISVIYENIANIYKEGTARSLRSKRSQAKKVVSVVVDCGAGTIDLNPTVIDEFEPKLKLTTPFHGVSTLYGAQQLNEIFVDECLPEILGESYNRVVKHLSGQGKPDPSLLTEPLRRGFETAKKLFNEEDGIAMRVSFDSEKRLPRDSRVPAMGARAITISIEQVRKIYATFLTAIYAAIEDQLNEIAAREEEFKDFSTRIVMVGGGSRSSIIMQGIRARFEPRGVDVLRAEITDGSTVAHGALLSAVDPELGIREFARSSFGTTFTIEYNPKKHQKHTKLNPTRAPVGCTWKWELPNRLLWGVVMDQSLTDPKSAPKILEAFIEIEEDEITEPLVLEMQVYSTKDPEIGRETDQDITHPSVQSAGILNMELYQTEHEFEMQQRKGERKDDPPRRFLMINARAVPRWDGLRLLWHFVVHKSGVFPPDADLHDYQSESHKGDYVYRELELKEVLAYEEMKIKGIR